MRATKFNVEYIADIVRKLAHTLEPDTIINEQAFSEIEKALGNHDNRIIVMNFSEIKNCTFTINVEGDQASLSQTAIYERQLKTIDSNSSVAYLIQTVINTRLMPSRRKKEKALESWANQADRWVGSSDQMFYLQKEAGPDKTLKSIDEVDEYEPKQSTLTRH